MRYDLRKFMFKNIGFFLVALVSAHYIVKGLYTLGESGKTVAQIIGDGGQHDVAVFPGLGNEVGDMGVGHIVNRHIGDALLAELSGQRNQLLGRGGVADQSDIRMYFRHVRPPCRDWR